MNELQIRLSADIKQFQAAMAKVENRLERAENILKKAQVSADRYRGALATLAAEFRKGNISQDEFNQKAEKLSGSLREQEGIIQNATREVNRLSKEYNQIQDQSQVIQKTNEAWENQTGIIAKLEEQAKQLRSALQEATSEQAIGNLNASLVDTENELTRLRTVGVDPLSQSLRGTNAVSNSLSRTLRDLPRGVGSLSENVRQLTSGFSSLSKTAGGTGPAITKALSSLITPANLALLAVSALTAAFTAYQLSTKGSKKEVEELKSAQDALNNSFKETEKLAKAGFYNDFLKEIGLLENKVTETGRVLMNIPTNLPFEEQLRRIGEAIKTSTKPQLEALQSFLQREYQESVRASANATSQLEKQLADSRANEYKSQLELINGELKFYTEETKKATKATEDFFRAFDFAISDEDIAKRALRNLQVEIDKQSPNIKEIDIPINFKPEGDILPEGLIQELRNKIASLTAARDVATDPTRIAEYNEQLKILESQLSSFTGNVKANTKELKSDLELIANAFSGMSFQISEALGISNRNLRAFVGTLISNTPKIIAAMMAQAKAAQAAAAVANAGNLAQAKGNAVVSATSAAKALGPVGLALLPVFISGALALVSGAFGKSGGGGSGGTGARASGPSQFFGNAAQPTRQEMRDSMSSPNRNNGSNRLEAVVTGDQIRFVLDQSGRRTGRG